MCHSLLFKAPMRVTGVFSMWILNHNEQ